MICACAGRRQYDLQGRRPSQRGSKFLLAPLKARLQAAAKYTVSAHAYSSPSLPGRHLVFLARNCHATLANYANPASLENCSSDGLFSTGVSQLYFLSEARDSLNALGEDLCVGAVDAAFKLDDEILDMHALRWERLVDLFARRHKVHMCVAVDRLLSFTSMVKRRRRQGRGDGRSERMSALREPVLLWSSVVVCVWLLEGVYKRVG
jgi:hypothetical protein